MLGFNSTTVGPEEGVVEDKEDDEGEGEEEERRTLIVVCMGRWISEWAERVGKVRIGGWVGGVSYADAHLPVTMTAPMR